MNTFIKKHPWVRTIYLYLFSLVGLVLMVIGAIRIIDLGLKIYIFTEADLPSAYQETPPYPAIRYIESKPAKDGMPPSVIIPKGDIMLTAEEKELLAQWARDYEDWETRRSKINYVRSNRQREASNAIAFMLVGAPLYLYHWMVIRRERRRELDS